MLNPTLQGMGLRDLGLRARAYWVLGLGLMTGLSNDIP